MKTHVIKLFIAIGMPLSVVGETLTDLTDIPANWEYHSALDQSQEPEAKWWQQFGDTTLDSLINEGIEYNYDIAMAIRRMEIARQTMNATRSGYMPTLSLTNGWTKARTSGKIASYNPHSGTTSYWSAGISMSWEIDLFGKIRDAVNEKKHLWQASRAEYAGTMVSLCANIASAYFNLRMYQEELALSESHKESQLKVVKITEARHEAGIASMLDVAQAQTVYYSTCANIPGLHTSIRTSINAIAILLGVFPSEMEKRLIGVKPLPDYHQLIKTGIPMELLRRRPDIVAAEMQLISYASALGVAKKEFLPTLTLNGAIGTNAHSVKDVFTKSSFTYTIAPTISLTLFDGMARRYNAIAAREQLEEGIENYNLTVLTAVKEADNAICSYINDIEQISFINKTVEQCVIARDLSIDLYKRGLSPFNDVVNAQIDLLEYQTQDISARGAALSSLVTLYEALGGGWNADNY